MTKKIDMEMLARELDVYTALDEDLTSEESMNKAVEVSINLILLKRQRIIDETLRREAIIDAIVLIAPVVISAAIVGIGSYIANRLKSQ